MCHLHMPPHRFIYESNSLSVGSITAECFAAVTKS
jgi:hypothetical protein